MTRIIVAALLWFSDSDVGCGGINGCEYDQFCRWLKVDALVCTIQYSIT